MNCMFFELVSYLTQACFTKLIEVELVLLKFVEIELVLQEITEVKVVL